jgi:hypothetical protein
VSWLDKIPASARHAVIVFAAAAGGDALVALIATRGDFAGFDYLGAAQHAGYAGLVALAAIWGIVLGGTTTTRQWGVGARKAPVSLQPDVAPPPAGDVSPGMSRNP